MNRNFISAALIIMLILTPINAQFEDYTERSIKAVAVVSGGNEGATINITVIVTLGNGRVFVSVTPFTEIDMQGSAQLSALTASDLTGKDFLNYDFFYIIEARSTIVGGPSAGGVMTVATIAALENLTLRKDVFMTGMIYPDGTIGPVGGIPYKLEAAAEDGAKVFLIPKGQRYAKLEETREVKKGPFVIINTETKTVDLIEYGKKFGVEVVEVENINEALAYYTGYQLERSEEKLTQEKYQYLMKILAEKMKEDALNLYTDFEKIADENVKKEVDERFSNAEKYIDQGYFYSATSSFFTAKIIMREEIYRKKIQSEEEFSLEERVIRDEIESIRNTLDSYQIGLVSLQIVGAAEERLAKAENYLQKALNSKDWDRAIANLALARERVESAKIWLSILPEIKKDSYMSDEELRKRADFYLSMAESIFVYAESIGGYSNLLYGDGSADESRSIAEQLYNQGYYAGTILTAMDSIIKSAMSIELIGIRSEETLSEKVNQARDSSQNAIGVAEKYTIPVLAYAYYEFGETSEGVWKIYYYRLSERIAKTLSLMGGKESIRIVEVDYKNPEIKTTPEIETVVEKYLPYSIPGFEAVFTIVSVSAVLIFLRKGLKKS